MNAANIEQPKHRHAQPLLRLKRHVVWRAEASRLYICHSQSLDEAGLPTQGLPSALLDLVLGQLHVGTTQRDLLFLLGREHQRKARKLLDDLEVHSLLDTVALRLQELPAAERLEVAWSECPDLLTLPMSCRVLVQSGTAARYPLPATLALRVLPEVQVHDIAIGGGQLVLAHRRTSAACSACLLLWFFGSRLLPLSFTGACLNGRDEASCSRGHRVDEALDRLDDERLSVILYFANGEADVVVDYPPGPHPACACAAFGQRPHSAYRRPERAAGTP
jgi:hypothetical protein